jgi:hypothetical protein
MASRGGLKPPRAARARSASSARLSSLGLVRFFQSRARRSQRRAISCFAEESCQRGTRGNKTPLRAQIRERPVLEKLEDVLPAERCDLSDHWHIDREGEVRDFDSGLHFCLFPSSVLSRLRWSEYLLSGTWFNRFDHKPLQTCYNRL